MFIDNVSKTVPAEYFKTFKSTPKLVSKLFNLIKALYHYILYKIYVFTGMSCDLVLANSSWTLRHCLDNWGSVSTCTLLYPPCNVDECWAADMALKENIMVSFAQFRPEKRHHLQLDLFKQFQKENPGNDLKFVFLAVYG